MKERDLREASRLVDIFSDADRLRLIGRLVETDWTITELSQSLGLKPQSVSRHLRSLEDAGLVRRVAERPERVAFDMNQLRAVVAALRPRSADDGADEDDRALRSFVSDGRLTRLPSQRSRWLVVLRWLVERFEFDVKYPEPEVNEMLGVIHPDHALLRRQLVDEGFMARDHGIYWRVAKKGQR